MFFIALLVPPAVMLVLYILFSIHLDGITHDFTKTLNTGRPAIVGTAPTGDNAVLKKPRLISRSAENGEEQRK